MPAQIMIVENDAAHRQLFRYLFEHAGHAVAAVATGSAALAHLGQTTPDLMVCDLQLVGRDLDGYAITAWCRRQPHLATVPILCVTASFDIYDVEKARTSGFTTTAWCRRQPHLATVPILCVTASFDIYDVEKARTSGFTTVIPKPINPATFLLQAEFYLPVDKHGSLLQGQQGP